MNDGDTSEEKHASMSHTTLNDSHAQSQAKGPIRNIKRRVRNLPPEKQAILLQVLERLEAGEEPDATTLSDRASDDGTPSGHTTPGRADSEWLHGPMRSQSLGRGDSNSPLAASPFHWWQPGRTASQSSDTAGSPPGTQRSTGLGLSNKRPQRRGSLPPMGGPSLPPSAPNSPMLRAPLQPARSDFVPSPLPPRRDRLMSLPPVESPSTSVAPSPATRRPTPPSDHPSPSQRAFARARAGSLPPLAPDSPLVLPLVTVAPTVRPMRNITRALSTQELEQGASRPQVLHPPAPVPTFRTTLCRAESLPADSDLLSVPKIGILNRHKSKSRAHVEAPIELSNSSCLSVKSAAFSNGPCQHLSSGTSDAGSGSDAHRDLSPPYREKFRIPTLPCGRHLTINIISNWGDPHYVGLSGLEVFDAAGLCISDPKVNRLVRIRADPDSVNVLPGSARDPRTVDKLLDGVHRTCDDAHMWLAPFSEGRAHIVHLDLGSVTALAMLRVWNYNKSLINSYRGARYLEVTLDDVFIFRGEVQKAPGHFHRGSNFADCILFTLDEALLRTLEAEDVRKAVADVPSPRRLARAVPPPNCASRPPVSPTLTNKAHRALGRCIQDPQTPISVPAPFSATPSCCNVVAGDRPATAVASSMRPGSRLGDRLGTPASSPCPSEHMLPKVHNVVLTVLSTWGDPYFAGLTGLQILNQFHEPIELKVAMLSATPTDVTVLPSHQEDPRVLPNLIDDRNVTTDPCCMWLTPFSTKEVPEIQVAFPRSVIVAGLRVWNYNGGLPDTISGVKQLMVHLDGKQFSPDGGFMLQKAPGHSDFDYGQTVLLLRPRLSVGSSIADRSSLDSHPHSGELSLADCDPPVHPEACVIKMKILSSHGDEGHVGLNAIAVYDILNDMVDLTPNNLKLEFPESSDLSSPSKDASGLERLVDGVTERAPADHAWLVPFQQGTPIWLYVVFEEPTVISVIKFWNYSKAPKRGVKNLTIWADDLLIYNGALVPAPQCPRGQPLFFTDDPNTLAEHCVDTATARGFRVPPPIVFGNKAAEMDPSGGVPNHQAIPRPPPQPPPTS